MVRKLNAGTTLVLDRYVFSGIAYGIAKGIDGQWARAVDSGLPAPDLTVFLDVDPRTAAARGQYGEERYEVQEFQERTRAAFAELIADGRTTRIDAAQSPDAISARIQAAVSDLLKDLASNNTPVRTFGLLEKA